MTGLGLNYSTALTVLSNASEGAPAMSAYSASLPTGLVPPWFASAAGHHVLVGQETGIILCT